MVKDIDLENNLIIYQAENGAIELRGDVDAETIWASQKEMAQMFEVTSQNITIHLKIVFDSGELDESSTCKESLQVQKEGKREVKRRIKEYNLDVLISVAYRVDSVVGTNFRKWATRTLKQHITEGYTINQKILNEKKELYIKAIDDIRKIAQQGDLVATDEVLDIIKSFSGTWFSLQSYDEGTTPQSGFTDSDLEVSSVELYSDVAQLKKELIGKGEVTQLFAQEKKSQALEGILGNVMQTTFGKGVYETLEEKASHLLYFVIKNHPFNDGNKRTGAFVFLWFLRKSGIDFKSQITPQALTALTLLVAQSDPNDKDRIIGLILLMFQK